MKAALLESVKNIAVKDVETPRTDEKSALVRVRACGICGSDLKFFNYGDRVKSFPTIIGHEIAGELVEVGKHVDNLAVGQRIALGNEVPCKQCDACGKGLENVCDNVLSIGTTLPGGLSEYMLLTPEIVSRGPINGIPKGISFDEAALAEPLGCVVNGFEFARMGEGKTVLIIGAGPVGCMMINLAQIMGAGKIVMVETLESRIKLAEPFGADHCINSNNFLDEALKIEKNGYDVVMSACSGVAAHENAIKAAAKGGFVNLFGGIPKNLPDIISFSNNLVHYKQIAIGGSFSQTKAHHKQALDYIAGGGIKTKKIITHKFSLDDIKKAFDVVEKQQGLKVIVNP